MTSITLKQYTMEHIKPLTSFFSTRAGLIKFVNNGRIKFEKGSSKNARYHISFTKDDYVLKNQIILTNTNYGCSFERDADAAERNEPTEMTLYPGDKCTLSFGIYWNSTDGYRITYTFSKDNAYGKFKYAESKPISVEEYKTEIDNQQKNASIDSIFRKRHNMHIRKKWNTNH